MAMYRCGGAVTIVNKPADFTITKLGEVKFDNAGTRVKTFDIKEIIPEWRDLTVRNFIYTGINEVGGSGYFGGQGNSDLKGTGTGDLKSISYDNTTGIVSYTVNTSTGRHEGGFHMNAYCIH